MGSEVRIFGGYDLEPIWLNERKDARGRVLKWIPGQNTSDACVVALDEELSVEGAVGLPRQIVTDSFLVLELRYVGDMWGTSGTVHIELLSAEPPSKAWGEREQGAWVESHATYETLAHYH